MPNALIIGASGTLGNACTRELHARGYTLGLHYCAHPANCEALAPAKLFQADFANPQAAADLAANAVKDLGRIDALVWAAGIVRDGALLTLEEADLRATLDVNLKAFFMLLKGLSRQFMKQKSGSIVALSSHAAQAGRAGGTAYAMAHAGLLALVKSAAREFGPLGVRVNAVVPPFVAESGMGRGASPEFVSAVQARGVLKTDADRARAVALCVANTLEAATTSGQVVSCDLRVLA